MDNILTNSTTADNASTNSHEAEVRLFLLNMGLVYPNLFPADLYTDPPRRRRQPATRVLP